MSIGGIPYELEYLLLGIIRHTSWTFKRVVVAPLLKNTTRMSCSNQKINYPSADRNKSPILNILQKYIQTSSVGKVLEIASGTGQHICYFAEHFPNLSFQPSECDETLLPSIRAHIEDVRTQNVHEPVRIDVRTPCAAWNIAHDYDYIINTNMMHISPPDCTDALFRNAAAGVLKPGGILVTYGPYARDGVIAPQSNVDFDRSLRQRNPLWGLRDVRDLESLAGSVGVRLIAVHPMPANNHCLIWQKNSNDE